MKSKFSVLLMSVLTCLLLSCSEKENVEPVQQESKVVNSDARISACDVKNDVAKLKVAGICSKWWSIKYFNAATGEQFITPITHVDGNLIEFTAKNRLTEYIGRTTAVMDTGTYTINNCGKDLILNTNLSQGKKTMTFTVLTPVYFEAIVDLPIAPDGSLLTTKVTGVPTFPLRRY